MREVTGGGADHAIETVGSEKVLADAYAATRRGGTTVTVGLPHPDADALDPGGQPRRRGAHAARLVPRLVRPRARHAALRRRCTATGRLPVERLLTHRLALDELNEGFDRLARGEAVRQAVVF